MITRITSQVKDEKQKFCNQDVRRYQLFIALHYRQLSVDSKSKLEQPYWKTCKSYSVTWKSISPKMCVTVLIYKVQTPICAFSLPIYCKLDNLILNFTEHTIRI